MPPSKVNIVNAVDRQVDNVFDPHIVGDVNDYQVKVAKFGEEFDWHSHADEDEFIETQLLAALALLLPTAATAAAPTVNDNTIIWPNDGWYQVQFD